MPKVLAGRVRLLCRLLSSMTTLVGMSDTTLAALIHGSATATNSPVVVGVDGSSTAIRAAHWAAVEAAARQAPLLLVHVARRHSCAPEGVELIEAARQAIIDRWAQTSRTPAPSITALTLRGDPAAKLIELSKTSALLVIGSRGRGAAARALLGSVATDLAAGSQCPVAVIRPLQSGTSAVGPVLVVTDPALAGSPCTIAAAFRAAADRHSEVLAVDVARPATTASSERSNRRVDSVIEEQRHRHPAVPVRAVTYLGHPRTAIEKFSVTAQLVVVGRSRRQHWPHLADSLRTALRHTRCALLIVPEGAAQEATKSRTALGLARP